MENVEKDIAQGYADFADDAKSVADEDEKT